MGERGAYYGVGGLHRDFVRALVGGCVDGSGNVVDVRKSRVGYALCRGGRASWVQARRADAGMGEFDVYVGACGSVRLLH